MLFLSNLFCIKMTFNDTLLLFMYIKNENYNILNLTSF